MNEYEMAELLRKRPDLKALLVMFRSLSEQQKKEVLDYVEKLRQTEETSQK